MASGGSSSLKVALDKALESLGEGRFQSLMGELKKSPPRQRRASLLESARPAERNASDAIANRVLGVKSEVEWREVDLTPDLKTSGEHRLDDIVSERFEAMRKKSDWLDTPSGDHADEGMSGEAMLGFDEDGTPVWRKVLEEHRTRLMALEPDIMRTNTIGRSNPVVVESGPDWPTELPAGSPYSFNNFHVCPENLRAARAVDTILDEPGSRWNPLLIQGPDGVGKSHLLWACGLQMARQCPGKTVRLLSSAQLRDGRPNGWERTIASASLILIDDLHHFFDDPEAMQILGEVVDYAINAGTQIVISSDDLDLSTVTSNRLTQVLDGARVATLRKPGLASRMTFLRERSAVRRLLLDDTRLAAIEEESLGGWRSLSQSLEVVAEAMERGASLDELMDIPRILNGEDINLAEESNFERPDVAAVAKELVQDAIEHVTHRPLEVDIELESPPVNLPPDDYEVPDLIPADGKTAVDNLVDRHLGEEMERMAQPVHHAISVDDRDKHLIHERQKPSSDDLIRVKRELSKVDDIIEGAFDRATENVVNETEVLSILLDELQSLSEKMVDAKARDLIRLVERLYEIEMKLHQVDPVRWPVPEMPKSRRSVRRKEPEPEPEAIWENPQSGNVSVARLRTLTVLAPMEEE